MKPTIYLSLLGLIIGTTWMAFGFLQMIFIVLLTLVGTVIGYWLESKQFDFKQFLRQLVTKVTE
ncbi:hypothetical protein LOOC260_107970 [Paucilactobacillus hokkaidonensis JCM 18461]|uniref:Small integral membrane protein n=2 Tax=Paucilactobacillus hokkaidonensis TaxID=1193095 RepID=A0A0A1GSS0_9LACO|nr:DUF2273 domain-containing protein [Paucilactobacillus hokkaidonensis]KRO10150.1 hypothetical protein IV59_GL002171 [Paucilactobacillus hokkaidonensis]BAP85337.1 hypothetical protein LOOC260_107970 [Paucilactobacillus hokkaidonensis JCM 18461]